MQNVKIISALLFGLIGFWAFSLVSEGEATHLLVSDTAAIPDAGAGFVVSFTLENQGAADRLIGVESSAGEAALDAAVSGGLSIPEGETLFTPEDRWISVSGVNAETAGASLPIQLHFEKAGTVSATIRIASR